MMWSRILWPLAGLTLLVAPFGVGACGSKGDGGVVKPHVGTKRVKATHGAATVLGEVSLVGFKMRISRLGDIKPGVEGAVVAEALESPPRKDWKKLNLYVWLETAEGKKLNAPDRAVVEEGRLHAHADLPADAETPTTVVVRVRAGVLDERASFKL